MASAWEHNTDYVVSAAGDLDTVPPREEREIVAVTLDQEGEPGVLSGPPRKECQRCGDAVDRREQHVLAHVWAEAQTGRILHKPVFCDRECWRGWFSRENVR